MRALKRDIIAALAAVAVLLSVASPRAVAAPPLKRLQGIEEMKDWFNAGKGHPRLVLLLSPT